MRARQDDARLGPGLTRSSGGPTFGVVGRRVRRTTTTPRSFLGRGVRRGRRRRARLSPAVALGVVARPRAPPLRAARSQAAVVYESEGTLRETLRAIRSASS